MRTRRAEGAPYLVDEPLTVATPPYGRFELDMSKRLPLADTTHIM